MTAPDKLPRQQPIIVGRDSVFQEIPIGLPYMVLQTPSFLRNSNHLWPHTKSLQLFSMSVCWLFDVTLGGQLGKFCQVCDGNDFKGPPLCSKSRKRTDFVDNRHLRKMNFWSNSEKSIKLASCGVHRRI